VDGFDPGPNGNVYELALSGSTLYAGGDFDSIGGQSRNHLAALDTTQATNHATPFDPNANGRVFALALSGSTLYAGGFFDSIGGQSRNHLAALDTTQPTNNATPFDRRRPHAARLLAADHRHVRGLGETQSVPSGRAARPEAAFSVPSV
jgi:trimeric autotransporter adhesin